ncbi:hypothetical protein JCM31447_21270 [Fluviispira sanaruensis]|uniref:Uncharacterized protein n=1 Tax=Fluviispira sanaruensis TaxID=2493639 RepID=A0A4P2VNP8_FLUSA|nr:hypothetical protein JCM31447_21270 [Fluviispira sanaruensis]
MVVYQKLKTDKSRINKTIQKFKCLKFLFLRNCLSEKLIFSSFLFAVSMKKDNKIEAKAIKYITILLKSLLLSLEVTRQPMKKPSDIPKIFKKLSIIS